jgi:hypothetical protein
MTVAWSKTYIFKDDLVPSEWVFQYLEHYVMEKCQSETGFRSTASRSEDWLVLRCETTSPNCCHYGYIVYLPDDMSWRATVEWYWQGKPEELWGNLSQYHFVHHKSHIDCPGHEPWPPRWEAGDNSPEPWHGLDHKMICGVPLLLHESQQP